MRADECRKAGKDELSRRVQKARSCWRSQTVADAVDLAVHDDITARKVAQVGAMVTTWPPLIGMASAVTGPRSVRLSDGGHHDLRDPAGGGPLTVRRRTVGDFARPSPSARCGLAVSAPPVVTPVVEDQAAEVGVLLGVLYRRRVVDVHISRRLAHGAVGAEIGAGLFGQCPSRLDTQATARLSEKGIRDWPSLIRVDAIGLHVATHTIRMLGLITLTEDALGGAGWVSVLGETVVR